MAKKIKSRLGADGYSYPYTHEDLIFNDEGVSMSQRLENLATKDFVNETLDNIKFKRISRTEYDALSIKDPNTLYFIIEE